MLLTATGLAPASHPAARPSSGLPQAAPYLNRPGTDDGGPAGTKPAPGSQDDS